MANVIGPEEAISGMFLDWNSLILVLFVLGVGYLGLGFIQHLRGKKIGDMKIFDKLIRSSLLGFLSFSSVLTIIGVNIASKEDIFTLIGQTGLALFVLNVLVCIAISYLVYMLFYILPNIQIIITE